MAALQHVRAAPLALALRTRASAAAPVRSPETSRRALLGLSEPELRQLAVDLGQVPSPSKLAKAPPSHGFLAYRFLDCLSCAYCLTHLRSKATGGSSCTTSSTSPGPSKSKSSATVGTEFLLGSCTPPVCCFASVALDCIIGVRAFVQCPRCSGRRWLALAGALAGRRCTMP